MKIVIIGSKGQLGRDCCDILSQDNSVVGCDIPTVDIGDQKSVDNYITETNPDVIINCAAYTAVDACESEQELAWRVNATGPEFLAKAANRHKSRLIHISTDYVFDGKLAPPAAYKEQDKTNPLSEYGRSKLAGEKAVIAHAENHLILRTAWLYSPYGGNFLKTMLRLTLADGDREIKVVNDQYGSLTWSYTLALQIQKLLSPDIQGIVHTTSDGYSTWYEAACYFLDIMGVKHNLKPCTTADYPTPAHRPANSILSNSRLDEAGISSFASWQEHLDTFVDKYREQLLDEAKSQQ
ncbi:dTDP-4-dehydrorhamnose reductase [Desulfosediminicola flagellatus]|uniref:dTDP-4-dehydrorhamnose reductase n=1 Tax=Desulfosediminicola flagellatus TaxID=2569541 RepID=UPI0010ACFDB3|nr:dTDP-4-dehydrorhamnose reductase [Desulfosediminicola flagellatus]